MLKWLCRLVIALFVIMALPSIAFTGLMIWAFPPTFAVGRGIGELSYEDQVAYLIFVDQMRQNEALEQWRREGGSLSIGISDSGDKCGGPSPALDRALSRSWAFTNIIRAPADCSSVQRNVLYVEKNEDQYFGGYECGALCGEGGRYRAARPFGIVMIIRIGGFIN